MVSSASSVISANVSASSKPAPDWVALAVFVQPHGVSGRIKIKSFTEPADAFAEHTNLTDESGKAYTLALTGHAQGMAIVTVEGITDRNQAALLRGKKLGIPRAAMPELKNPHQYYTDDLIGMAVIDHTGSAFGEVIAVVNYGASDILEIRRPDGAKELYAFTNATFPTIDTATRVITIDPPVILSAKGDDETA